MRVEETQWYRYVLRIAGDAKATEIADRAGFDKSALTRWKQGASADPFFVVKFARAYDRPVLEALVEAGLITAAEAELREVRVGEREALQAASNDEILDELRDRIYMAGQILAAYDATVDIAEPQRALLPPFGGMQFHVVGPDENDSTPMSDRELADLAEQREIRRKATPAGAIAAKDSQEKK